LLAATIVYPDQVLDWIGERTGKVFGWKHVACLEVIAIGVLILTMKLLMPVYPKLTWWYPLAGIGLIGLFRIVLKFLVGMFGFDD
jgi:hypothetical protein